MKKILLCTIVFMAAGQLFAQTQIGNSDFESWEAVGPDEEPVNWNSFMTAGGGLTSFAANQIEQSADVRPGSAGTKSCRIWAREIPFVATANGNVTLGQVIMGNISPTNDENHNISVTADPDFSEALTDAPDSVVFWAKFTPASGDSARMRAVLHDSYDYMDPDSFDAAAPAHSDAVSVVNFAATSGWQRFSVPFDYAAGPAASHNFILMTFTTNKTPGQGSDQDELLIDDVELIYNGGTNGVSEEINDGIVVSMNNENNTINIYSENLVEGTYEVFNTNGESVKHGVASKSIPFEAKPGIYFVHLMRGNKINSFKILKK